MLEDVGKCSIETFDKILLVSTPGFNQSFQIQAKQTKKNDFNGENA
jgi:hypothetical protein